jgi:hypothetical protein
MKSQTLFIDASRCTGTSSRFGVVFEPDTIKCGDDERLTLTLEKYSCLATWPWVPEGSFFVYEDSSGTPSAQVVLPWGNPRLGDIAQSLQAQLTASHPGAQVNFDAATSLFTLSSDHHITLYFSDPFTATLLGFEPVLRGPTTSLGPAGTLVSSLPCRPLAFDSIRIDVQGLVPYSRNACTSDSEGQMRSTDIIAAFPVNVAPFCWVDYENHAEAFSIECGDKSISALQFSMTDWDGNELSMLPAKQYLQIRVDTNKILDDQSILLTNILRTIQLVAVQQS